jgi:putative thiazole-containing bacteriocin maturation protein
MGMTGLKPSMRLKVKGDTFFLPDPSGGVHVRNNVGSLYMEGRTILQWMEKLMPVLNGEHTLEELTDGLPAPHRNRVYEIAEVLYNNGFVRDVSRDRPHQLPEGIRKRYAEQIEFLDSFADSGAYRFQTYRQTRVAAAGAGTFLLSLAAALLESGLPRLHVLITDEAVTNRQRLAELAEHARKEDPEVSLEAISLQKGGVFSWREFVQPFDAILYVSEKGDVEELRLLQDICRQEKKVFLPALCIHETGMAGPLVHPDSAGCWESAWRRLHLSSVRKDPKQHAFSSTAAAMLANVMVFEWFKTAAGVFRPEPQFFLLDLETLEGSWHSFLPHPLVTGCKPIEWINVSDLPLERDAGRRDTDGLTPVFSRLTSPVTGILHVWEPLDTRQIPLAQCVVQAVDPLAEGPDRLQPAVVCTGLTHDEARREAGLAGIEAYVTKLADRLLSALSAEQEADKITLQPDECIGIGAGETAAEGVSRGLRKCLTEALRRRYASEQPRISLLRVETVADEPCRYYLQALTTMQEAPLIGLGEDVCGFPVVWVGLNGRWYGSVGFHVASALRQSLQQALQKAQNQAAHSGMQAVEVPDVLLADKTPQSLSIPACEADDHVMVVQSALQVLRRNNKRLLVCDLALEPFLREGLAGVFGVLVREEESR